MLRVAYDTKPREELFCKVDYAFGPQYRAVCTSQVPAYEANAPEAWIQVYKRTLNAICIQGPLLADSGRR